MILALLFFSHFGFAHEKPIDSVQPLGTYEYTPGPNTTSVERELDCIKFQLKDKPSPLTSRPAAEILQQLYEPLEQGFKDFHFTPTERALFYSQVLAETMGFTQLTEAKNFSTAGADAIGQVVDGDSNTKFFRGPSKNSKSHKSTQMGDFRGRGLLQITGCDNYLSVIHYLNLLYSHKTPYWQTYWILGDNDTQITSVCGPNEIKLIKDHYPSFNKDSKTFHADLYGVLSEPRKLASLKESLEDPLTKKHIASEKLMVDASMAYWRGKCDSVVDGINDDPKLLKSSVSQIAQNLTKCVRGSTTAGWKEREEWLKFALGCSQKSEYIP
jgi:hypothetical protein